MKDNLSIHIKKYFLLTFDEENRHFKLKGASWITPVGLLVDVEAVF